MGYELMPESTEDVSVQIRPADPVDVPLQPAQPETPKLDEKQVREAMRQAAENGVDPFDLSVGDLKQGQPEMKEAEKPPVQVPEKFKKPNGEVDVEKLNASTRQLDEAIQKKQEKLTEVQKSVEDYVREYNAKQKQMSQMPNPDKIAAQLPPPPAPVSSPSQLTDQQLEEMIANDMRVNPGRTVAQLVQLAVARGIEERLKPLEEDRRLSEIRGNIAKIAENDPRILNEQVFNAVNQKLQTNPELWNLKNPHKAAWLEVKEDMRLGEVSNGNLAQPSKAPAPVLAGGTPPPAPSLSANELGVDTILDAAKQLGRDPRTAKYDPKKQAALDAAAKQLFDSMDRKARRF